MQQMRGEVGVKEGRALGKGSRGPLEAGKERETNFALELPKGVTFALVQ